MTREDRAGGSLPRIAGLAGAALLLTGFFTYLGFPYDRLAAVIEARIESVSDVELELGHVSPHLSFLGPGVEARPLRITTQDGQVWPFERVFVRPAWSFAWLTGRAALATRFEGPLGEASGTLVLGEMGRWSGSLRDLELGRLPFESLLPGGALDGQADVEVDITWGPQGLEGPLQFEARDGSFEHPSLPVALAYERLVGHVVLGGDYRALVELLEVHSPILEASLKGTVGHAPRFASAPLNLELELEASSEVQGALNALGIQVGRDGAMAMRLLGTPSQPIAR